MRIQNVSEVERLILFNQYQILEKLSDSQQEAKMYFERAGIIAGGYTQLYPELTSDLFEELKREECDFVSDMLSLYTMAYISFSKLTEEEKDSKLEDKIMFKGFDLSDHMESKLYRYADFMINTMGSWQIIKQLIEDGKVDLNNHGSGLSIDEMYSVRSKWMNVMDRKKSERPIQTALNLKELEEIFN